MPEFPLNGLIFSICKKGSVKPSVVVRSFRDSESRSWQKAKVPSVAAIILGQVQRILPGAPPAASLGWGWGADWARLGGPGLRAGGPASRCPRPEACGVCGRVSLGDARGPPSPILASCAGEVSGSGHRHSDLRGGQGEERNPGPTGSSSGRPRSDAGSPQGQLRRRGPAGCALCGCENPERRIGARSQPTPPRSGHRAGHAQWPPRRCPPTRKLALPGRGGENVGGGQPASPAAPRQPQTSLRPRGRSGRG